MPSPRTPASAPAPRLVEAVAPLRAHPERTAVLLDVDGTLAPIVTHLDDAAVPQATRRLLLEIAERYAIVACVSGRRASDARRLVGIGSINYLGAHGAEVLRAGWTEPVIDGAVEEWELRIKQFAREHDTPSLRTLRVRAEDKGAIVAFHWRGATDAEAARAAIDGIAAHAERAGLRTHWGRKVLEIRPPVRIDKGAAIETFLGGERLAAALYVGDDATDVDAFRGLTELVRAGAVESALRVAVRSEEGPPELLEQADLVLDGTDGVRDLLAALVAP